MIGIDASVAIPWFEGRDYPEVRLMEQLLQTRDAAFPPVVVTEILSGARTDAELAASFNGLLILPIVDGYWVRAGQLRSKITNMGRRARLADTLVAQACIDAEIPLLTRDIDFQVFTEVGGLELVQP
jgi:predicted nucleic acid-binding protein